MTMRKGVSGNLMGKRAKRATEKNLKNMYKAEGKGEGVGFYEAKSGRTRAVETRQMGRGGEAGLNRKGKLTGAGGKRSLGGGREGKDFKHMGDFERKKKRVAKGLRRKRLSGE